MRIKVERLPKVRTFGKKYEAIEVQERLLRVHAHMNAEAGNSLLSKWMSESADRLTNLREANELAFIQFEADRSESPKSATINQNDPFDIPQYDAQGDALYDDEPSYIREPYILPKYPIDEDVTNNPNYHSEYPLWDFVTRCAPEQLSSITNPALYDMMRAYKD